MLLASEIEIQAILDRRLASSGRRTSEKSARGRAAPLPLVKTDGFSVGQSLSLIVIGCACYPTSKRAFSACERHTTLGALAGVDLDPLTSQHFWKQMDQVPVPILQLLARVYVRRERRWSTVGESPTRELDRSAR
jgi:hypothetical protein